MSVPERAGALPDVHVDMPGGQATHPGGYAPPPSPEDAKLERDLDYLSDADDLLDRERGEVVE